MATILINKTNDIVKLKKDTMGQDRYVIECSLNYPLDEIELEDVEYIKGDIIAKELKTKNPLVVLGNIKITDKITTNLANTTIFARHIYAGGDVEITGSLIADSLNVEGNVTISENAYLPYGLNVRGDVAITGSLQVSASLEIFGRLTAKNILSASVDFGSTLSNDCQWL